MKISESRDKMPPIGRMAVFSVIVGILLLGLFVLQNHLWYSSYKHSVPPLNLARQIHADLTAGFLSFMDATAGEKIFQSGAVLAPFDRTADELNQWILAQSAETESPLHPGIDSTAVRQITLIRDEVNRFRLEASGILQGMEIPELSSTRLRRLDKMLVNIELQASVLEDMLARNMSEQFYSRRTVFSLVAVLWLIIGILTAGFLTQVFRKHRRIERAVRESRQMLQSIMDTIPVRVFWKDAESRYIGCNRLFAEDAGLDHPSEIIGKTDFELGWREQAELYRSDDRAVVQENKARLNYEEPQTAPDGRKLWLRTSKIPLHDLNGETIGILGTYEEITEWKEAEKALRESMQSSADIVAAIPSGLLILQYHPPEEFVLLKANPEAEFLLSIEDEKWRGREFISIMPAAGEAGLATAFLEVMKTGKIYITENLTYKDNRIDGSFRIRAFRMAGDRLGVALENITERTRAYEALRESQERYRFLYRNMPVIMQTIDVEGRLTNVNRQWLDKMGYERAEVLDCKITDFMTLESRRLMKKFIIPQMLKTGACRDRQIQMVKKDGEVVDGLLSFVVQNSESGKIVACHGILIDITDLKQTEKRTHKFFRAVEQSPGIVIITDPQGMIEYVNPRFTEVTGYTFGEVHGRDLYNLSAEFRHPDIYEKIKDSLRSGKSWSGNILRRRKNGEPYWERFSISPVIDSTGRTINCLAIGEDITNEIMMFRKLADSEKNNAIGVLAAGVAHEFKNYLCGIIGNASHTLENLDDKPESLKVKNTLSTVIGIAEQADNIATSLLTYSRASSDIFQPDNLQAIIERTLQLIRKEMEVLSIGLLTHFEETPEVVIASGKIQQLILNLLTNAQQAISSDGLIMVSLLNDGDCVRVRISDTGGGIATDVINRIYDPFFSTKGVWGRDYDVGTGMGLATCRNIAREHGGDLNVDALHGAGAVFTLSLPLEKTPPDDSPGSWAPPPMPRIVLASTDFKTVEYYFNQAQKMRFLLYSIGSAAEIDTEGLKSVDLIIIDAATRSGAETIGLEPAGEISPAFIIVNARNQASQDQKTKSGRLALYTGLPDLSDVIGQTGVTTPDTI